LKKLELGQLITILANFGVIAGIVFLAVELQQNNDQLATQIAITRAQMRVENIGAVIHDEDLAVAQLKLTRNEQLTDTERERLYWLNATKFVNWELNYTLGLGDPRPYIQSFRDQPASLEFWTDYRRYLIPEFVEWVEENVIQQVAEK